MRALAAVAIQQFRVGAAFLVEWDLFSPTREFRTAERDQMSAWVVLPEPSPNPCCE